MGPGSGVRGGDELGLFEDESDNTGEEESGKGGDEFGRLELVEEGEELEFEKDNGAWLFEGAEGRIYAVVCSVGEGSEYRDSDSEVFSAVFQPDDVKHA